MWAGCTHLEPDACSQVDLPPASSPHYGCTQHETADYSGDHFYAEAWLANNYSGMSQPVTVELWVGSCGGPLTTMLGSVTQWVTNLAPGQKYTFDFGVISSCVLVDQALILTFSVGGAPNQTHIYWDSFDCPTGLHARPVGLDPVVCEPQAPTNPTHPVHYWFDVTPGGGFGRCDFHVQVFDPDIAHYSNWMEPVNWVHSLHGLGSQWWVSWYNPGCDNAIFSTFRFGFDNPNPSAWGGWRTTIAGTEVPEPAPPDLIDSSDNHLDEENGHGARVHVPEVITATRTESWGGIKAIYR